MALRIKQKYFFAFGLFVSVVALIAVVRNVDWYLFVFALRQLELRWLGLAAGLTTVNMLLRAVRWHGLLKSCSSAIALGESFRFFMIGYMSNLIFPLKAGELIRPYLLGRKQDVSVSGVFATIVIERLADIICLGSMLVLAVYVGVMQIPIEVSRGVAVTVGIALLCALFLGFLSQYRPSVHRMESCFSFLPRNMGRRVARRLILFLDIARQSVRVANIWPLVILTFASWTVAYFVVDSYILASGFNLPWYAPVFVLVIVNFGIIVPSSPGAVGLAHILYVYSLSLFGVGRSEALAFAVVVHGIGFLLVVGVGLVSTWIEGVSLREIFRQTQRGPNESSTLQRMDEHE